MAPVHKIAVIQLQPEPLAVEANHARAIQFIRDAAAQGCDLAVLPEYHLTHWVPEDPGFIPACADYQKYVDAYRRLAQELQINIVPGTIVEKHGSQLLNVAYFISSEGEVLGSYQKKNLWHPERPHLTSSQHEPHEAIDTPLGKVGLLICWDLAFPEAFRALIASGAQIIIIPTFWGLGDCNAEGLAYNPLSEEVFLDSTLTARCFENTCAVVFANGGDAGLSQVAVPFKGALGKLQRQEGMSIVELDMRIIEVAEANYKVREDMGREDWHYEYSLKKA
ncbi:hypothetical protein BP5796_04086 [Coleophoma crateriformis]|uniref:CN hydrolase domain-containing protein n=1 Tax=Coleophoma crateriformis TaxID=565419 RepID=A0A3D8SHW3_9HELO|nr:hypothetical protein BP5796_04086 [Coleophoma crateriformis]